MNDNRYAPPEAPLIDPPTASDASGKDRNFRRFFAAVMFIGGLAGIAIMVYFFGTFAAQGALTTLLGIAFIALFAWAAYAGWRLWQGTSYGRKWATILYIAQIPLIALPGLQYVFYTGIEVAPSLSWENGNLNWNVTLNAGANGTFYLGTANSGVTLGVNLFALIAAIWLVRANKRA
jgi:hypothetical protein